MVPERTELGNGINWKKVTGEDLNTNMNFMVHFYEEEDVIDAKTLHLFQDNIMTFSMTDLEIAKLRNV